MCCARPFPPMTAPHSLLWPDPNRSNTLARRTHPLTVKIDRALFEEVRDMLVALDDERHSRYSRRGVPWGAWSNLLDTILRDWLTTQQTILRNRQAAKEFANG